MRKRKYRASSLELRCCMDHESFLLLASVNDSFTRNVWTSKTNEIAFAWFSDNLS